jgi:hypothetical protein
LYERGWDADRVRQLFNLIDWLMELPKEMRVEFHEQVAQYEREKQMPFVNTFEEIGMERGLSEGRHEDIESILEIRFPEACSELMREVRRISDHEQLKNILRAAVSAANVAELRKLWTNGHE